MNDVSGPGYALIVILGILAVVLLATAGLVVTRRAARRAPPAPPLPPRAPERTLEEAPAPLVEAPPVEAPPVETPPEPAPPSVEAPPGEAPPGEAPPVEPVVLEPPVVAAPEPEPEAPAPVEVPPKRGRVRSIGSSIARVLRGSALTDADWEELEETLLRADVGVAATERIVSAVRARRGVQDGMEALRAELVGLLGTVDRTMKRKDDGLTVWLVTGVNGSGKTTTIGKLSAQLAREGRRVILAAADTFRAAADEQLQRWADASGAEIVRHAPGGDPAAVVFDGVQAARARGADVLIVDTAGRLQNKRTLMEELAKIRRVLDREAGPPDEVLLVLDATTGQNGVQQARAFTEAVQVTGVALTKLDGSAKGGIVIAVQQEFGIPVKLVGLGEGIDDLSGFDPHAFVDDLLAADP